MTIDLELCIILALLTVQLGRRRPKQLQKHRNRKLWSRKWLLRRNEGRGAARLVFDELKLEDPSGFKNFTRMSSSTFEMLLSKVAGHIQRKDTVFRECIPVDTR